MKRDTVFHFSKIPTFVLVFCLAGVLAVSATNPNTTITVQEVDQVFQALGEGEWKKAESLAKELMDRKSPAQINLMGRLRYIYIYSIAKQIERNELSHTDIVRKLKVVEGKLIVQPWHPVNTNSTSCFNQICSSHDKPHHLYTAQTNGKGTQIYSFEYYDTGNPIDISSFNGQNARLGGIVKQIEVNKNLGPAVKEDSGVTWYLRLHVNNSFIHFER